MIWLILMCLYTVDGIQRTLSRTKLCFVRFCCSGIVLGYNHYRELVVKTGMALEEIFLLQVSLDLSRGEPDRFPPMIQTIRCLGNTG